MARIVKTIIQVTVLHEEGTDPNLMDLEDLAHEIDQGDWLGSTSMVSSEVLPDDCVVAECQALGNDGSFFVLESEEE